MRRLALAGGVFLLGAWFGFSQAHAASSISYTHYLDGASAPKMADAYLNGYAAGTFDTMDTVVWFANESPKDFTAAALTQEYQCLQKIQNDSSIIALAKPYWAKAPNIVAANTIMINACSPAAATQMVHTMTASGGRAPKTGGANAGK